MPMEYPFSRRDFLKLLSALPVTLLPKKFAWAAPATLQDPGVIILVCDAMPACNLSLYGYPRKTSPNLERFAARAFVYHSHYSAGNFTVPGAASLLTGTYPWKHRAFHYAGRIAAKMLDANIFRLAGNGLLRLGYSQNPWVDLLLYQFSRDLDLHIDADAYNLTDMTTYNGIFAGDPWMSFGSVENFSFAMETGFSGSPLLGMIRTILIWARNRAVNFKYKDVYPLDLPRTTSNTNNIFTLEDLFEGLKSLMENAGGRSLEYLHIFPPHSPYAPRAEDANLFTEDGWYPVRKEAHFLSSGIDDATIDAQRSACDAYIHTLDVELGRFFDFLAERGILDTHYVIVTSDHGEMLERGVIGHVTPLLFDPVVRVPLLISAPGQTKRVDVYEPTSCVDILPTVLSIFDKPATDILEGRPLPGFGEAYDADTRPVYFMDCKSAAVSAPITKGSMGMRKGRYKLIRYYSDKSDFPKSFELYDMQNDPEELHDLGETEKELAASLVAELDKKMEEVNQPYL